MLLSLSPTFWMLQPISYLSGKLNRENNLVQMCELQISASVIKLQAQRPPDPQCLTRWLSLGMSLVKFRLRICCKSFAGFRPKTAGLKLWWFSPPAVQCISSLLLPGVHTQTPSLPLLSVLGWHCAPFLTWILYDKDSPAKYKKALCNRQLIFLSKLCYACAFVYVWLCTHPILTTSVDLHSLDWKAIDRALNL